MTPYHVSRSKVFVRERFGRARVVRFNTLATECTPSSQEAIFLGVESGTIIVVCSLVHSEQSHQ
jgi:hypothetical protein